VLREKPTINEIGDKQKKALIGVQEWFRRLSQMFFQDQNNQLLGEVGKHALKSKNSVRQRSSSRKNVIITYRENTKQSPNRRNK
jgi:hypothetical protein